MYIIYSIYRGRLYNMQLNTESGPSIRGFGREKSKISCVGSGQSWYKLFFAQTYSRNTVGWVRSSIFEMSPRSGHNICGIGWGHEKSTHVQLWLNDQLWWLNSKRIKCCDCVTALCQLILADLKKKHFCVCCYSGVHRWIFYAPWKPDMYYIGQYIELYFVTIGQQTINEIERTYIK